MAFVIGSVCFFSEDLTLQADWLFLIGSILFAVRPSVAVIREVHLARPASPSPSPMGNGRGPGPAETPSGRAALGSRSAHCQDLNPPAEGDARHLTGSGPPPAPQDAMICGDITLRWALLHCMMRNVSGWQDRASSSSRCCFIPCAA